LFKIVPENLPLSKNWKDFRGIGLLKDTVSVTWTADAAYPYGGIHCLKIVWYLQLQGLSKFENVNDLVWTGTCDLPACSIAPQQSTLELIPRVSAFKINTIIFLVTSFCS
jgi:hypothetical protein